MSSCGGADIWDDDGARLHEECGGAGQEMVVLRCELRIVAWPYPWEAHQVVAVQKEARTAR